MFDPDHFYWTFIRPAEEEAEQRRERRKQRKARRQARLEQSRAQAATAPVEPQTPPSETELVTIIDQFIRTTHHKYGYRHFSEIGQYLHEAYPTFQWVDYGCKRLRDFLEKYPDVFRIKESAPAHKGKSQTWVRLAYEPKRREGYSSQA